MDPSRARLEALLSKHPMLEGLPPSSVGELLSVGEGRTYPPSAWMIREGDTASHFWLLLLGSVKVLYQSPDGLEVTVKLLGAPAAFGEIELLTDHPHVEDCMAVDRSTVLRIPKREFSQFLDAHPKFMRHLLRDTCARFLIAAQNERALAFQTVEDRLANLLLAYLRMYGVSVEGGTEIRIPLSHESLASGVGANKKSITRALARWKSQRVLTKRGRYYIVQDPEQLASIPAHSWVGIDWVTGAPLDDGRRARGRRR